jgi:hypothetical protein
MTLGYATVKISKLDAFYMEQHIETARNKNADAIRFKAILRLYSVSVTQFISINDELAESLISIRSYIKMEQRKLSLIERVFFKLELNNAN